MFLKATVISILLAFSQLSFSYDSVSKLIGEEKVTTHVIVDSIYCTGLGDWGSEDLVIETRLPHKFVRFQHTKFSASQGYGRCKAKKEALLDLIKKNNFSLEVVLTTNLYFRGHWRGDDPFDYCKISVSETAALKFREGSKLSFQSLMTSQVIELPAKSCETLFGDGSVGTE